MLRSRFKAHRRGTPAPFRRVAFAVVVTLLVGGGASAAETPGPRPPVAGAPSGPLFVRLGDGRSLTPVNAATLADRPGPAPFALDAADGFLDAAMSGDGSTLVTIGYPRETEVTAAAVTIVVRDGRTGAERGRFHPPGPVARPRLSDDGDRLIAETNPNGGAGFGATFGWYVFDTRDGRLLATVETTAPSTEAAVDPRAERLYVLESPVGARTALPTAPPRIVAHDLATGAEAGRVTLADLRTGSWPEKGAAAGNRPDRTLRSGLAVSPDGRRLVLARADRAAITLINAETLAVERTVPLTRAASLGDRLRGFFALAPRPAAAKMSAGITLWARFGPDGRHLYLFGTAEEPEGHERLWARGLGLKVVEVATGRIVAEGLAGEIVDDLSFSRDGRSAYAVGPTGGRALVAWVGTGAGERRTSTLRRLDAATGAPLAERRFADYPHLFVGRQSEAGRTDPRGSGDPAEPSKGVRPLPDRDRRAPTPTAPP